VEDDIKGLLFTTLGLKLSVPKAKESYTCDETLKKSFILALIFEIKGLYVIPLST
jgi:hypothetical protein